jgi:cbb3-type cytochrome oxidase subunit 3
MKLSDVMSAANGLSFYAEVALVIFLGVFLGVVFDLLRGGQRHEAMRLLPLDDERAPRHTSGRGEES